MKTIVHKADSRGHFNHGWLRTFHTFSFADYYDPDRVNFGALRVLNDDSVDPGKGFDMHSHKNMEIISIPLMGVLEHEDTDDNSVLIRSGDIQVMSAGSGIHHSEYNASHEELAEFLQIWIEPYRLNIKPRYEYGDITHLMRPNKICEIVCPYPGDGNKFWICQDAWISLGELKKDSVHTYKLKSKGSFGVYIFLIEGIIIVEGSELTARDGQGIYDSECFDIEVKEDAKVLLIEVPK